MKSKRKIDLLSFSYLRSFTRQEVFKYIRKLHRIVKKQQRRLQRCRHKLKFLNTTKESEASSAEEFKEKKEETEAPKTFLEEIKEAAESAQNKTDFVYEPTSGLYYDQRTGYYYNAEYGLYYDGSTGCYYKYDQEKNEFEFHSQVQVQVSSAAKGNDDDGDWHYREKHNGSARRKRKKPKNGKKKMLHSKASWDAEEMEDGELSTSSSSSDDVIVISDSERHDVNSKYEDIAKRYPPSLRIIVQETNLPKLKIGTLFIITFKGGSLGREGSHDVIIPDVNISKFHLKFSYDETDAVYKCTDLGSRNGTILNGKRMSNAKQESDPLDVVHGSVLQLSQTKLLCHIHNGNSTCGHCEPGLIIDPQANEKVVTLTHKQQLKCLQKRYGLENEKYVTENKNDPQYSDRAAARRDKVGSTNDYEKTEIASVETAISSTNKGFKMLSKMGWNKGESLGKSEGLLEPINLKSNLGTTGLGCEKPTVSIAVSRKTQRKTEAFRKIQQRYNALKVADIFADSDSDSD